MCLLFLPRLPLHALVFYLLAFSAEPPNNPKRRPHFSRSFPTLPLLLNIRVRSYFLFSRQDVVAFQSLTARLLFSLHLRQSIRVAGSEAPLFLGDSKETPFFSGRHPREELDTRLSVRTLRRHLFAPPTVFRFPCAFLLRAKGFPFFFPFPARAKEGGLL